MQSRLDPRHRKRRVIVKELFGYSFKPQKTSFLTAKILQSIGNIDNQIASAAPTWPVDKINKIDLAILRLAVYELNQGITPLKVVVDEAIELGKEYGSENSASFINGVLGKILQNK